jgi:UDP-glucose 4-epimerase
LRVLVTGASGAIGSAFVSHVDPDGALELVRCDLHDVAPGSRWPFVRLDVTDPDACAQACRDVDAVVHLAADPDPDADWRTSVLPVNVGGTYNVFEAAVAAGAQRVVFASSGQVVLGRDDHPIPETAQPRPTNDYGAGKAAGEALCSAFAARSSTTFVAVRLGAFAASPADVEESHRGAWLSPRDAAHLLERCLLAPVTGYLVVNGTSANGDGRLSIDATRAALDYRPVDDVRERRAWEDDPAG